MAECIVKKSNNGEYISDFAHTKIISIFWIFVYTQLSWYVALFAFITVNWQGQMRFLDVKRWHGEADEAARPMPGNEENEVRHCFHPEKSYLFLSITNTFTKYSEKRNSGDHKFLCVIIPTCMLFKPHFGITVSIFSCCRYGFQYNYFQLYLII